MVAAAGIAATSSARDTTEATMRKFYAAVNVNSDVTFGEMTPDFHAALHAARMFAWSNEDEPIVFPCVRELGGSEFGDKTLLVIRAEYGHIIDERAHYPLPVA
jgi:hypothetical protein